MLGPPCRGPPGTIVLIHVCTYVVKKSEKRRSRNSCGGSPLTVKGIQYAKNYAAYASQNVLNIFLALSIALGYIIMTADDINSYSQVPPQ